MRIKPLHPHFAMPIKSSENAAAFDILMPEAGGVSGNQVKMVGLGFSIELPAGFAGLLIPRSGVGAKYGVELNNTCGLIDSDYRGEWKAAIRTKSGAPFHWQADDRVLQFMVVPVWVGRLELSDEIDATVRGQGGFGSTGR